MNINLSLTLTPNYSNDAVAIQEKTYSLSFELEDGRHVIATPFMDTGQLSYYKNATLMAQLSFAYEYDAENKVITIDGPDYNSDNSMKLTTYPQNTNEFWHQKATEASTADSKLLYNPNWNYNTPMTPNLAPIFTDIVKTAINTLIQVAKATPGLTVQVRTMPPKLTQEEHEALRLVYVGGKFAGLFDPSQDYGTDYTVKTIESVWGGTVHFNYGENFANVIGSTGDPRIAGLSWIRLWENQFGPANTCTSLNYNGFNCGNSYVGGHVILGTQARAMPRGSNSVYIMPICHAHNNNDNVYMAALQYQDGVWLNNYLN